MPPTGRTITVARESARNHRGAEMVKAQELIEAHFARGQSPSLTARRAMALMLAVATPEADQDKAHRILKKDIRQLHKGNERMANIMAEVSGTRFTVATISGRGRAAMSNAALFEEIVTEDAESGDAWIEFRLSRPARRILAASSIYAVLNRSALLSLGSKYSVTLYELGCLYCGRRDPTATLTIPELRERLGVPDGKYADWAQLRRRVLEPAQSELDHLAHFKTAIEEHREGRRVAKVSLTFWQKQKRDIDAAADELERPKPGRRARRRGTVERIAD